MAVISSTGFRTHPGKLAAHLAASAEALGHLHRLGMQAVNLQAIAGSDVGTVTTTIGYANNAAYAAGLQKIIGDAQWQEFWGRISAAPSADQVESSLFNDIDDSFQPDPGRPLGVVLATQWRAKPGRLMDFIGNVMASAPHIARLGGLSRSMQSLIGAYPMTVMVATTFADLDAYGKYADATATDAQWLAFWAGAMADPTADLVRSSLLVNISG